MILQLLILYTSPGTMTPDQLIADLWSLSLQGVDIIIMLYIQIMYSSIKLVSPIIIRMLIPVNWSSWT